MTLDEAIHLFAAERRRYNRESEAELPDDLRSVADDLIE